MHSWISGEAGSIFGLDQLTGASNAEPGTWWAIREQNAKWQIETART